MVEHLDKASDGCRSALRSNRFILGSACLAFVLSFRGFIHEVLADEGSDVGITVAEADIDVTRVEGLERRFLALEATIMKYFGGDNKIKERLAKLFKICRENAKNAGRFRGGKPVPVGAETGFSYLFAPGMQNVASFHGKRRIMRLSDDFDPNDLGHLAVFAHELAHVEQDDGYRKTVSPQRYGEYASMPATVAAKDGTVIEQAVAVPQDETDAVARSLEFLNAAMDGALRRNVLVGRPLNIPTSDEYLRKFFEQAAWQYYVNPDTFSIFMRAFLKSMPGVVICNRELRCGR